MIQVADLKIRCRGQWRSILPHFGVNPDLLNRRHGPCPICGGKDRFRFDDKQGDGTFVCNQCGAGDGLRMIEIQTRWEFSRVVQAVAQVVGMTSGIAPGFVAPARVTEPTEDEIRLAAKRKNRMIDLWNKSKPIEHHDPVEQYLVGRGIRLSRISHTDITGALRYSERSYCKINDTDHVFLPAMVARVENLAGDLVSVHRTYLNRYCDTVLKAAIDKPKRLMPVANVGDLVGCAIQLFPAGEILGVAEGIETALAAYELTGIPTWACISAGGLQSVLLPEQVKYVHIFADNDENNKSQTCAQKLADRLVSEGRRGQINTPDRAGEDWNDVLVREKK